MQAKILFLFTVSQTKNDVIQIWNNEQQTLDQHHFGVTNKALVGFQYDEIRALN